MPGTVALADMVTRVRRRAHMTGSLLVTDAEVEEYVEQSLGSLLDLVLESAPSVQYVSATITQSTVAGTQSYIPADISQAPYNIYKVVAVEVLWEGEWRKIRPYPASEHLSQEDETGWTDVASIRYLATIASPTIVDVTASAHKGFTFIPTPQAVHSFRVRFIPYPGDWSTLGGTYLFQGYTGWEEWIVCDAAAKCLEKERSFEHADRLRARRDERGDQIRWAAVTADLESQGRIRDLDEEARMIGPRRAGS